MKIGDKVRRRICYGPDVHSEKLVEGTVVYVHPKLRYYTAEFHFRRMGQDACFRESFECERTEDELASSVPAYPNGTPHGIIDQQYPPRKGGWLTYYASNY